MNTTAEIRNKTKRRQIVGLVKPMVRKLFFVMQRRVNRKKLSASAAVLFVLLTEVGLARAQRPSDKPVVRLDPALDSLVSPDAKLEIVKSGFGFTEGTNWVQKRKSGFLIFSDIPANVVNKMTADGKVSVFLDHSGYNGPIDGYNMLTLGHKSVRGYIDFGSDGLTLDPQGRLVICALGSRAVVRIEKNGSRTVLADRYEGKRLNGPNDVVVKNDGAIYFSDTLGGLRGGEEDPSKELDIAGYFMIKDRKVTLAIKDIPTPNGLAFSPDEKYLYANSGRGNYIRRYDVQPDDTLTNSQMLIDLKGDKTPGFTDGMRVDSKGNIYSTGPGGIWIITPDGKHLGTILTPESVANLTFGDPDYKTLYIAAHTTIYKIRVNTAGHHR